MKLLVLALSVCGLLCAQQPSLTDARLMGLAQAGVSEAELVRMVGAAQEIEFDLQPVATDAMMKAGVSAAVIRAMAARENGQGVAPSYSEQRPLSYAEPSPATSVPAAAAVPPAAAVTPAEPPTGPSPVPPVTPSTPPRTDSRTRIYIGETSEWQASSFNVAHSAASFSGFSGSAGAGSFGMSHAGLMKLTISVMNHVNRHCPGTLIVNRPDLADLFVRLDQSTSMWARHDDMAVFNRAGEMVFVTSTHSISKDAKRFCNSIALPHP